MTEQPTNQASDPFRNRNDRRAEILARLQVALANQSRRRRQQRVASGLAVLVCASGVIFWATTDYSDHSKARDGHARITQPDIPAQPIPSQNDLLIPDLPGSELSKFIVRTNPNLLKTVLVTNHDMAKRSIVESVSDDELAELLAANPNPFIVARIDHRLVVVQVGSKSSSRSD